jgi:Spy/CpxP family protein refolding chaperone
MKKHLALLSLIVAGLAALPYQIFAEDAVPPKPPGGDTAPAAGGAKGGGGRLSPEERLKKMTEELSLTQDQQDKIKAIFEKYGPQMKELMAKGRENLTDDDKKKFGELIKSQTEDIAAVLTPEQKDKFKAAMEKRRAERAKQ